MDDTGSIKEAVGNQLSASLVMLENAIVMCPAEHWDTSNDFWYVAYHTLFWTDYYLTPDPAHFVPPYPFTLSEFDPAGRKPDRIYTKSETLVYLSYCKEKAQNLLASLTPEKFHDRWINAYKNFSMLEILLYNLRHIQHHTGQLNLLLRQTIQEAPSWVSQVKMN